jgi:hypothetical protein
MHIKLKPTATPLINWNDYPNNGCTATPIRDCNVTRSSGFMLNSNFVWSVDSTLTTFAGAAFATTGAIMGFLVPGMFVFVITSTSTRRLPYVTMTISHHQ